MLLELAQVPWRLGGGACRCRYRGQPELAGTRERLPVDIPECLPPPHLGCTVVEDTQGLFRKHREEELEERKSLYR